MKPEISTLVFTYNQENYITQTLWSITNQETDFDVEVIVGEDASTDNTRQVCQDFIDAGHPNVWLYPEEKNVGYMQNFVRLVRAAKGKYIAVCAGDDYWVGDDKLQLQYDFLEKNPDYGFVHTNHRELNVSNGTYQDGPGTRSEGRIFEKLLTQGNDVAALTVLVRRDLVLEALDSGLYTRGYLMEDYPLWLRIALKHKVGFINKVTAVWRYWEESASVSKDPRKQVRFNASVQNVRRDLAKEGKCLDLIKSDLLIHYRKIFDSAYVYGMKEAAADAYHFLKEHGQISLKDQFKYLASQYPGFSKSLKSVAALKRKLVQ